MATTRPLPTCPADDQRIARQHAVAELLDVGRQNPFISRVPPQVAHARLFRIILHARVRQELLQFLGETKQFARSEGVADLPTVVAPSGLRNRFISASLTASRSVERMALLTSSRVRVL